MTFKHDDTDKTIRSEAQAPKVKPAPHDLVPPKALLEFMVKGWKPNSEKLPPKLKNHEAFNARRRALSKQFPGDALLVPTGHEKVRANDTHYRFRPGSDFYYLTGNLEPDCVLLMVPKKEGGHRDILFVEPNPGKTDATFFTDRLKGELWVGPRLGVAQSQARFAVEECKGLDALTAELTALRSAATAVRTVRGHSKSVDQLFADDKRDAELATFISEMRLRKDAQEVRELQTAIDSTFRGFEDVIRGLHALPEGGTERTVEGIFNLRARVEGNDVGYGTIAASGNHACVLHWTRNDGVLKQGDLLLLDAGVEGNSLYTADITRTLPLNGKFSKEQREVYELVFAAQEAALAEVRPGNDFMEPNRAAMKVLAHGLEAMGILTCSAKEALEDEKQFFKRYSLHNVSHMLGLDVHDCALARLEVYRYGKLEPGMVLTVEPGLYFQIDDLTVPARYRGIGVRIEDDVLVTKQGYRNLSSAIPREAKAVEAWMASLWKKPKGGASARR
ncbi:MAG: aminopeptidase P family protein [Polyangiales bacterium]